MPASLLKVRYIQSFSQNIIRPFVTLRQRDGTALPIWISRAKVQTNSTVFNKQTQILGYVVGIDIISRSQATWEAF
jgi:hypothetical protein